MYFGHLNDQIYISYESQHHPILPMITLVIMAPRGWSADCRALLPRFGPWLPLSWSWNLGQLV